MTLLGNSWGGMLISFYAAAHPGRVARMILHNPGEPTKALAMEAFDEIGARLHSRYNAEQRKRYAYLSNPQSWVKATDPRAVCREWFGMLAPTYVSKDESLARFKGDVCAGPEEAVRYQQVVKWARGFPNARLLLVKDSGHLSHVEQPEIFFGVVETFLKGGWPPGARKLPCTTQKK